MSPARSPAFQDMLARLRGTETEVLGCLARLQAAPGYAYRLAAYQAVERYVIAYVLALFPRTGHSHPDLRFSPLIGIYDRDVLASPLWANQPGELPDQVRNRYTPALLTAMRLPFVSDDPLVIYEQVRPALTGHYVRARLRRLMLLRDLDFPPLSVTAMPTGLTFSVN